MVEDVIVHIQQRLMKQPASESQAQLLVPEWIPDVPFNDPPVPAAIMIALVRRDPGWTIVFTQRSSGLRAHSGQIAFPGGKIDPEDDDPAAGAIREAHEEIGLTPERVKVLGFMPSYYTGTNFLITPVVTVVENAPPFVPNPREVDEVFEVPLDIVVRADNFSRFSITRQGQYHSTWQLLYRNHVIWGITANLAWNFREMALAELDT